MNNSRTAPPKNDEATVVTIFRRYRKMKRLTACGIFAAGIKYTKDKQLRAQLQKEKLSLGMLLIIT